MTDMTTSDLKAAAERLRNRFQFAESEYAAEDHDDPDLLQGIADWKTVEAYLATQQQDGGELERLQNAFLKEHDEICQILGKALGYPRFCDDQRNFPGVIVGTGGAMSEVKFKGTPGPWSLCFTQTVLGLRTAGYNRDKQSLLPIAEIIQADGTWADETAANAHLIAAAPDLLEALRPFAAFACDEPHVNEPQCQNCIARAAIARATKGSDQ